MAQALRGLGLGTVLFDLLIVGGADLTVLELNHAALAQLAASERLAVVPGATHLFEEPGALAQVAGLAGDWFVEHLGRLDATTVGSG